MRRVEFLSTDEILSLHHQQIHLFGGRSGIRDLGLLESALAMPTVTYGGTYLHPTIFEMAAAYLFHLARDHPFVDANKRVALAAALVFLELNGIEVIAGEEALTALVFGAAVGRVSKAEIAVFLKEHVATART
jgi:death-on-curing protein